MRRFSFLALCLLGLSSMHAASSSSYMVPMTSSSTYDPISGKSMLKGRGVTPLAGVELIATIYETSPGLRDLQFVTSKLQFNSEGQSQIQTLAGPSGTKLDQRKGQATFLYQDSGVMAFLHHDEDFEGDFTNIVYMQGTDFAEIVFTKGSEYGKAYAKVKMPAKKESKRGISGDYAIPDLNLSQLP